MGCYLFHNDCHYIKTLEGNQRFGCRIDVLPETVGQYTGLKDKNGKGIYEGDIIENYAFRDVVVFGEGRFHTSRCEQPLYIHFDMEVIGNIFDNKDLLEGKS